MLRQAQLTSRLLGNLVSAACLLFAVPAAAECSGQLIVNGKVHALKHCALAVMPMEGRNSVSLLASVEPIGAVELEEFPLSAYSRLVDAKGMPRTGVLLGFCAGGVQPDPKAAKQVQTSISVANAPMLGRERALPDGQGRIEFIRLAGQLSAGQSFSGALKGTIKDSDSYLLELQWNLPVPKQEAASGISCY